jgi:amino acid transporter
MVQSPRAGSHLRRDSLSLSQIVASTLANIAPAMSFYFGFGVIVAGAGVGAPLTILLAMLVVLFLSNTVGEFSRYRPSTGSFVTFIGMSFGPAAGAAASVFVTVGYCIVTASVVAICGGWAHSTLKLFVGGDIPWQWLSVVASVITGVLVARGIRVSTTWAAIFFYFELLLLLAAAAIMLVANHTAISWAPLLPTSLSGGLAGVGAGFPLAIYLFIGWENSAMLAEETIDPRRNIPRALLIGTLVIGALYVLLAYSTEIAFHDNGVAIGKSAIPFIDAFKISAPGMLLLAYLAGLTSIFSSLIGAANSQARILFSSGREGLLPAFCGKIHPLHKTPHVATWTFIVCSLAIVLIFGYAYDADPVTLFGEVGTLGAIPIVLIYLLTNLSLPVYMLRHHRSDFSAIRHLVIPLLGTVLMLFPLYGLIEPGQPYPFNLYPYWALGLLVFSIGYGLILARTTPDLAQRLGSFVADEER